MKVRMWRLTADADVLCRDVGPLPAAGGPAHLAEVVVGGAVGGADGPHRALAPLGARARRDALPRRRAEAASVGAIDPLLLHSRNPA